VTGGRPGGEGPLREQVSWLWSLLALSMILTQQDSEENLLRFVAHAVESLGPFKTYGIFADDHWQDVRPGGPEDGPAGLPAPIPAGAPAPGPGGVPGPTAGGLFTLEDVPWSWAYALVGRHGRFGYLVVGAKEEPAAGDRFVLHVLAQQAGVALANAHLHGREREQARELGAANLALRRSMEIHDRLTRVALGGEGQDGIAQAVYELTGCPVAIEDRFGNRRAWAGPGEPDPGPKAGPDERDRLLTRIVAAGAPVRDGDRVVSVALLGGLPAAVLVLSDPAERFGDTERVAVEHATTVLAMEVARLQSLAENDARMRVDIVLDLITGKGPDDPGVLNRAQAIGYDLNRPHRVAVVDDGRGGEDIAGFFSAVGRAARAVRAGSLLAPRFHDVVLLADTEAPWEKFRGFVVTELGGGSCLVGVGGRCAELNEFPRSYQEAQLALRIQKTVGGAEQVTRFDDLGVYKVLATADDASAMERFMKEWLGTLIDYDAGHGTQLVLTLSEYLDCGGNYDATARALSVHRSTLKYRLRRIRQISGHDLGLPDVQFNLQVATRAWRILQALRQS
jgi:sugar diacid utilization regulator